MLLLDYLYTNNTDTFSLANFLTLHFSCNSYIPLEKRNYCYLPPNIQLKTHHMYFSKKKPDKSACRKGFISEILHFSKLLSEILHFPKYCTFPNSEFTLFFSLWLVEFILLSQCHSDEKLSFDNWYTIKWKQMGKKSEEHRILACECLQWKYLS